MQTGSRTSGGTLVEGAAECWLAYARAPGCCPFTRHYAESLHCFRPGLSIVDRARLIVPKARGMNRCSDGTSNSRAPPFHLAIFGTRFLQLIQSLLHCPCRQWSPRSCPLPLWLHSLWHRTFLGPASIGGRTTHTHRWVQSKQTICHGS